MGANRHRLAELRSLALHREVARRLAQAPALAARALARVEAAVARGAMHPDYAAAWRALLIGAPERLREVLCADTEAARALRQATPFTFVVEPAVRQRLWREAEASWARDDAAR